MTEVDDDGEDPDHHVFLAGPSPDKGPPNGGTGQTTSKPPRVRKSKEAQKKHRVNKLCAMANVR